MKKTVNIIMIGMFLGWFLTSCELDKYPYDSVASEDTFNTVEDATNHINGLYSQMRNTQYGIYTYYCESQSDLFNATSTANGYTVLQEMSTNMLSGAGTYLPNIWRDPYYAIARVNNFLEQIGKVSTSSPAEETMKSNYIAEAHYFRAYFYYVLIKHYGENYESEAVARNKLGLPLITEYDVTLKPARASLFDIYDFIRSELTLAEALTTQGISSSTRLTVDAVRALKSKILLLMGDNTGAAQLANALINSGRYPLNTTEAALRAGWLNDNTTEDIFLLNIKDGQVGTSSRELKQDGYARLIPATQTNPAIYKPLLLPTQTVVDLYEANDLRNAVYLSDPNVDTIEAVLVATKQPGMRFITKWLGNPEFFITPGLTNHRHRPKVHRIAEQYLIAAEASKDVSILNELRTARGASALPAWSDEELRNEWAREMIGEGVRMECLKRWQVGLNGRVPQPGALVDKPGDERSTEKTVPANYYRFTWPIPDAEMKLNSNLRQIPEWENPV